MADSRPRVVYLGDLDEVASALARSGAQLAGWIAEPSDDARSLERAASSMRTPLRLVLDSEELDRALESFGPVDLGFSANFGILLSPRSLSRARFGFYNLHFGLLPERPGRRPVEAALLAGDRVAGLTVHRMTECVDRGPILLRKTVAIPQGAAAPVLFDRLRRLAPRAAAETFDKVLGGIRTNFPSL